MVELLSPAGSYESFEAALGAGADAVYLGGISFGARAYAENFSQEELVRAIRTAHIHGKKVYLTVNTLQKNRELYEDFYPYLAPYYEEGLDAVIVQDLGVLRFIRENFPDLPIHASTQMTVTGPCGMKFLEKYGVTRVVPARELSLAEISAMHNASPMEIECFIHGAMCYSFSGQCLMSSILGGRSGNRGKCAQPCRLPYAVSRDGQKFSKKDGVCPLSMKDICTLDILPDILRAGVTSLKIEGRMKSAAYTAGVTGMYRKYLDILLNGEESGYHVEEKDRRILLDLYSRGGSCTGYYRQHNGASMMAFSNEKKIGGAKRDGKTAGDIIKRKEKIHGKLILFSGSPVILDVSIGDRKITVRRGKVQQAGNRPLTEERVRSQMEKLGETEFEWASLDIRMGDSVFVPVRTLNDVRREAVKMLEETLLEESRRTLPAGTAVRLPDNRKVPHESEIPVYVSCETKEQAERLCKNREITGMYLPADAMRSCMERGVQREKELFLALPHIARGQAPEEYFVQARRWLKDGMRGFLARCLESYGMLKELGLAGETVLDASMYTWNGEARDFWEQEGILRDTVPLELNEKELRRRDNSGSELLIYGYFPVMLSAQCVRGNLFGCDRAGGQAFLKDRYGKIFPAVCCCDPWKTGNTGRGGACYNIIYNSVQYGLLEEREQVKALGCGGLRLSFTMETPEQAEKILEEFLDVYRRGATPEKHGFTKGHFKRGAE